MTMEEEAAEELEALEAILPEGALKEPTQTPDVEGEGPWKELEVGPEEDGEEGPGGVPLRAKLTCGLGNGYPQAPPALLVTAKSGISDAEAKQLEAKLNGEAEGRVGMPMILDLYEVAREALRERAGMPSETPEAPETAEEKRMREEREAEERLEQVRSKGTPATYERLAAFLERLEAEYALSQAKVGGVNERPTGKEVFFERGGKDGREVAEEALEEVDQGDVEDEDDEALLDELLAEDEEDE